MWCLERATQYLNLDSVRGTIFCLPFHLVLWLKMPPLCRWPSISLLNPTPLSLAACRTSHFYLLEARLFWHVQKDTWPSSPELFFSHSSFLVNVCFNLLVTQAKSLGINCQFLHSFISNQSSNPLSSTLTICLASDHFSLPHVYHPSPNCSPSLPTWFC